MTDDRPTDAATWPEPPSCPSCKTANLLGASNCWLCGADLPATATTAPVEPKVEPPSEIGPQSPRGTWLRPRISLATTMIGVAVVAVFLAVGQGRAGMVVGLALIVGPSVGYLIARVLRVNRGDDEPTPLERTFGEIAATILAITVAAAILAAVVLFALQLLRALAKAL
ncbi:hypothetical protein [Tautonia marina]|uniref:hypothetical protein n=1 Tax=Tautonia marina TaxID=2653855 RepID=UPI001260EE5D|nr:hypothetical protein [Tautonia marina]